MLTLQNCLVWQNLNWIISYTVGYSITQIYYSWYFQYDSELQIFAMFLKRAVLWKNVVHFVPFNSEDNQPSPTTLGFELADQWPFVLYHS